MKSRSPYEGTTRKLVIAFDIGTTFSGISYCVLDPGLVPEIKGVTRFPGQEKVGGDAKIPSIIYYDRHGNVKAVGGEAKNLDDEWVVDDSDDEDEKWIKCEWFKLHLAPKSVKTSEVTATAPPLPPNKSEVDVFADFMEYLFQCAKSYIIESHLGGDNLWLTVHHDIEFVLSHPNGWEGAQQSKMRRAAVMAGLVTDTDSGHARIHFVTEGEASLHYCIQKGLDSYLGDKAEGILLCDAGGGTIDLSCYAPSSGTSFEEIASPECLLKGSVFVTRNARVFLENRLRKSIYLRDLDNMINLFDSSTKLRFRNPSEPSYIKFGSLRDKDPKVDIRSGQLRLSGEDVATFFDPSITAVVQAVERQRAVAKRKIRSVFLVGGFAASEYLFTRLQESLQPLGLTVGRPDTHVNKAVADGAISFYLDHFVSVRVSRFTCGIECNNIYNPTDPEHISRESTKFINNAGDTLISNHFDAILPKNTQVSETAEYRRHYSRHALSLQFKCITESVLCYRGQDPDPRWTDVDRDKYDTLCTIEADTSALNKALKPQPSRGGRPPHYRIDYDIVLSFGLTELTAQCAWFENGVEKRSLAKIIYNEV